MNQDLERADYEDDIRYYEAGDNVKPLSARLDIGFSNRIDHALE